VDIFHPGKLHICASRDESKMINQVRGPAIVISASGMCTGGRILHHLAQRLPHSENTLLFIGYQAEGTRGRDILDGAETIRMHGRDVPVNAHIDSISGFSGHADYNEILAWLMSFNRPPEKTFIVHGEPGQSKALAEKIKQKFGWDVVIPGFEETYQIDL
jgi:metallo-beta-lactamase family protein